MKERHMVSVLSALGSVLILLVLFPFITAFIKTLIFGDYKMYGLGALFLHQIIIWPLVLLITPIATNILITIVLKIILKNTQERAGTFIRSCMLTYIFLLLWLVSLYFIQG